MFVVVYRWQCTKDDEAAFRDAWHTMTGLLRDQCGTLGSRLHRADDGTLMAYAQWPSRQRWESARATGPEAEAARATMQRCARPTAAPLLLEVLDDLLGSPAT